MTILRLWVVYENPSDYRGWYVVRCQEVLPNGGVAVDAVPMMLARNLEHIRDELRERGLVCLARDPNDDPVIVETWL